MRPSDIFNHFQHDQATETWLSQKVAYDISSTSLPAVACIPELACSTSGDPKESFALADTLRQAIAQRQTQSEYRDLPVDWLVVSPTNPRKAFECAGGEGSSRYAASCVAVCEWERRARRVSAGASPSGCSATSEENSVASLRDRFLERDCAENHPSSALDELNALSAKRFVLPSYIWM